MEKCSCGSTSFKECYLSDDNGPLYYVEGKPSLRNQLFGKKKKITVKACAHCGLAQLYCKK